MSVRSVPRRRALAALAVCAAAATALLAPRASRADLIWDPNGASPGAGGSGDWNTTSPSWFTGTSHTFWDNITPQLAIFGPAAGTLTLTSPITATSGMRFDVNGYLIQSDTLTLGGTLSGTGSAAIASTIAGNGFTLAGN